MLGDARCFGKERDIVGFPFHSCRRNSMNSIIYIVGLIVVIGFILGFLGLR